jgi:hypothetical protein
LAADRKRDVNTLSGGEGQARSAALAFLPTRLLMLDELDPRPQPARKVGAHCEEFCSPANRLPLRHHDQEEAFTVAGQVAANAGLVEQMAPSRFTPILPVFPSFPSIQPSQARFARHKAGLKLHPSAVSRSQPPYRPVTVLAS